MNETMIIGNIGQDAQIKDFNGKQFISFNVCDSESYTDADGVKHEKATWISCLKPVFNGSTKIAQYLKKGTQVFVRGHVSSRAFQKSDGTWGSSLNIKVDFLQLLSGGRKEQGSYANTDGNANAVPQQKPIDVQMPDEQNGDLPF